MFRDPVDIKVDKKCVEKAIECKDFNAAISLLLTDSGRKIDLHTVWDRKKLFDNISTEKAYEIAISLYPEKMNYTYLSHSEIKKFSHRIGMSGTLSVPDYERWREISLEGCNAAESMLALRDVLEYYSSTNTAFKPFYDAVTFKYNLDCMQIDLSLLNLKYYQAGNPLIFHVDCMVDLFGEHHIGMGVKYNEKTNKTYIIISNRGYGDLDCCLTEEAKQKVKAQEGKRLTGTVVYEIDGLLDKHFFDNFGDSDARRKLSSVNYFNKKLNIYLQAARFIAFLPAQPQGHGTCSYVNLKRTIEGLLLVYALCSGQAINQKMMDEVYYQYKLFSVHDKKQAFDELASYYSEYPAKHNSELYTAADGIKCLNQFLIAAILEHRSSKYDGIELLSVQKLYNLIPPDLQAAIKIIAPEVVSVAEKAPLLSQSMFQLEQTKIPDIKITGDLNAIDKYSDNINTLLSFLNENSINSRNGIRKIMVQKNGEACIRISQNVAQDIHEKMSKNLAGAFVLKNSRELIVMDLGDLKRVRSELQHK